MFLLLSCGENKVEEKEVKKNNTKKEVNFAEEESKKTILEIKVKDIDNNFDKTYNIVTSIKSIPFPKEESIEIDVPKDTSEIFVVSNEM
jgi:hypothetical protein